MKKNVVILIIVFAILIVAGIVTIYSQVPEIKMTYNDEKVEVQKCPFGWDSFMRSFRADYPTPDILAKDLHATVVKPESNLDVKFSRKPNVVDVKLWDDQSYSYNYDYGKITVPKEKGIYIFEVWGFWKQGEVLYVFKVEVR